MGCLALEGSGEGYLWWGHLVALTLAPCLPSPFEVQVSPEAGMQKVRAWGPGLETGQVGKSADFVVEAIGDDVGTLGELAAGGRAWRGPPRRGSRVLTELAAVGRLLGGGPVAGQDRV